MLPGNFAFRVHKTGGGQNRDKELKILIDHNLTICKKLEVRFGFKVAKIIPFSELCTC